MPITAVSLTAVGMLASWAAMVGARVERGRELPRELGVVVLPALLLTVTGGGVAFTLIRALGHLTAACPTFMTWIAKPRSAVDAWAAPETAEPPFFKASWTSRSTRQPARSR